MHKRAPVVPLIPLSMKAVHLLISHGVRPTPFGLPVCPCVMVSVIVLSPASVIAPGWVLAVSVSIWGGLLPVVSGWAPTSTTVVCLAVVLPVNVAITLYVPAG